MAPSALSTSPIDDKALASEAPESLADSVNALLKSQPQRPFDVPFLLLYDAVGLQLFEQITRLSSYYPARAEACIVDKFAQWIAGNVHDNTIFLELGSGSLYKTRKILDSLDRSGKENLDYYALDVDQYELDRTLSELPRYSRVNCHGFRGTFDDGFRWLQEMHRHSRPVQILFLGSSIGNFSRGDAQDFLKQASQTLRVDSGDAFYITFDHCSDYEKIWNAYHDPQGLNQRFLMNALHHANRIMGQQVFDTEAWKADGEIDRRKTCHKLFYSALKDTHVGSRSFRSGERMSLGQNIKYSRNEVRTMFEYAGLSTAFVCDGEDDDYALYKLVPSGSSSTNCHY